ncbi:MAG: hypothetical protein FWC27_08445 [Firmicutes bacterium]|nr:hypothetical protein [Bacillota bacterium]
MKKLFVCAAALALLISLAACGGKPEASTPATTEAIETTAEPESTSIQDESEIEEDQLPALPTDTAGIAAYYNTALGNTKLRRASFKRTMTKVTSWAVLGLVDEQDMQDWPSVQRLANVDETKSAPSDLAALRPEWVREASAREDGGTAALTIRLKDHPFEEIDPKPGTYGYVGTIDKPTAEKMVFDASVILTNGILTSADVTKALFALTGGVYTVSIDTQTGKIISVRFSATQAADGEAKCRAISIAPIPGKATVTLKGDMTATYVPV